MAASDAADSIFEAFFANNFDDCPVVYENDDDSTPPAAAIWLYVENESDEDDQASIGAGEGNLRREFGTLGINVLVPVGSGRAAGRQMRDQLVALISGQDIGALTCRAAHRINGFIWEGERGQGNWFSFPLTIDWYRDY